MTEKIQTQSGLDDDDRKFLGGVLKGKLKAAGVQASTKNLTTSKPNCKKIGALEEQLTSGDLSAAAQIKNLRDTRAKAVKANQLVFDLQSKLNAALSESADGTQNAPSNQIVDIVDKLQKAQATLDKLVTPPATKNRRNSGRGTGTNRRAD